MLKGLSEFVIKVADLAEAEGRQLRAIVSMIAMGFAFVITAALVSVIGVGLLVLALYNSLEDSMGPAGAALIAGVVTLGISGGLGFAGWKAMSRRDDGPKGGGA